MDEMIVRRKIVYGVWLVGALFVLGFCIVFVNRKPLEQIIDWSIEADGWKRSESFAVEEGNEILLMLSSASDVTIHAGIIKPNGEKEYVIGRNYINTTFVAEKAGAYRVFVENTNEEAMQLMGRFQIYDPKEKENANSEELSWDELQSQILVMGEGVKATYLTAEQGRDAAQMYAEVFRTYVSTHTNPLDDIVVKDEYFMNNRHEVILCIENAKYQEGVYYSVHASVSGETLMVDLLEEGIAHGGGIPKMLYIHLQTENSLFDTHIYVNREWRSSSSHGFGMMY